MRGLIAAGAILLFSGGSLWAADLPVVTSPDVNPARFGWDGFYVGVAGGYAWLKDVDNSFVPPLHDKGDDWNVGGYAGYLAQYGDFVAGGEVQANYLGITYETASFIKVENSYDVRARVGYAVDRFLLSGHGGGVYMTTNYLGLKDWGWEAGAGIDYALTDNIIVGADYTHYGFNNFDGTEIDGKVDLVSARVGYKF